MKKIVTLSMSILTIMAFTAVSGEVSPTLFNTKWKLQGFFNAEANGLEKLDSAAEDRYTLEFAPDSSVSHDDKVYKVCRGKLSQFEFWSLYVADYAKSTIDFEAIIRPTTAADSEDGERFDRALYLSKKFEMDSTNLKIYYGDNGDYLLFGQRGQSDIIDAAGASVSAGLAKSITFAPEIVLAGGDFTAAPNPVAKSAGLVKFYRDGRYISRATLKVFDSSGKFVRKIQITDNSVGNPSRRQVGSWDLRDAKGRLVAEGAYLVRGAVKTAGGKSERISLILGVR
jgi:hypothetical protein